MQKRYCIYGKNFFLLLFSVCIIALLCRVFWMSKGNSGACDIPVPHITDLLLINYPSCEAMDNWHLTQHDPFMYRLSEKEKMQSLQILEEILSETETVKLRFLRGDSNEQFHFAEILDDQIFKLEMKDTFAFEGDMYIPPDGHYGHNKYFSLTLIPSNIQFNFLVTNERNQSVIDGTRLFITYSNGARKLEGRFSKKFIETCLCCVTKDGRHIWELVGAHSCPCPSDDSLEKSLQIQ